MILTITILFCGLEKKWRGAAPKELRTTGRRKRGEVAEPLDSDDTAAAVAGRDETGWGRAGDGGGRRAALEIDTERN